MCRYKMGVEDKLFWYFWFCGLITVFCCFAYGAYACYYENRSNTEIQLDYVDNIIRSWLIEQTR